MHAVQFPLWFCSIFTVCAYFICQTAEEVSFAANGITATGIKAFDGVLQCNIMLKTLNLSGNAIGDDGVKVCPNSSLDRVFIAWYYQLRAKCFVIFSCSQCLCDILVNNNGIQKLQLNSTDVGDEVSLLLAWKLVPWWQNSWVFSCKRRDFPSKYA